MPEFMYPILAGAYMGLHAWILHALVDLKGQVAILLHEQQKKVKVK